MVGSMGVNHNPKKKDMAMKNPLPNKALNFFSFFLFFKRVAPTTILISITRTGPNGVEDYIDHCWDGGKELVYVTTRKKGLERKAPLHQKVPKFPLCSARLYIYIYIYANMLITIIAALQASKH